MVGVRVASSIVAPLVRKLFVREGPGAGLADEPVRISGYVSFKGEKRTLNEDDLRKLAAELVKRAVRAGERPVPEDEERAVSEALARTLHTLGDLDLTDAEAVGLGHRAFATRLRSASGGPDRHLSSDATHLYERLLDVACLHILHFFTQRSEFVPRTLVEQSRRQTELVAKVDELIARTHRPDGRDAEFEERYLAHIAKKHGKLTIFGIDLANSPRKWQLSMTYLSLRATGQNDDLELPFTALERPGPNGLLTLKVDGEWFRAQAEGTHVRSPHEGRILEFLQSSRHRNGSSTLGELRRLADTLVESCPADQALADHERVLLRGEAGYGKTTLVQWLAVSASRRELDDRMAYVHGRIPYVLPLRTLTRHGERLPAPKDFLAAVGSPLAGAQPNGWEDRVLRAGRGLVLIDGIDEIPEAERPRTRTWLSDLIEEYPGNRWLVTSRPSAVRQGWDSWLTDEDFTELTLSAMNPADVAAFIKKWHAAARTDSAEDDTDLALYETQLLEAVRTKPDLGRLATNPLMCGLICALHRDRHGFLPFGRKDLYTAALSMLLIRRDRERDMKTPELREEPQIQLLQRLAYWLIRNGRTEMDRSRAESIVGDALSSVRELACLGDAKAVFEHFLHRSGLLREPSSGTVDFIHRTFQDFLGARAAVDEGDFGLLVEHAADDQWEDVIRMSVAHARPRERAEILRDLIAYGDAATDPAVQTRVYLLTAACLEHAADLAPGIRGEVERRTSTLIPPRTVEQARSLATAGPLILDLLPGPRETDEHTAEMTVVAASYVRSERAIPFLARYARDGSQQVQDLLARGWEQFDTQQYANEVIAHLKHTDLTFHVSTDEQLDALRGLGARPRLSARGPLTPSALRAYTAVADLVELKISDNENLTDLAFLSSQTRLTSAVIERCPHLRDVSGLRGLPITDLSLSVASGTDLALLQSLRKLFSFWLAADDLSWSLDSLPSHAPLRAIDLTQAPPPTGGLRGISRFANLHKLFLGASTSPQSSVDWNEMSRLPHLRNLYLSSTSLATPSSSFALPSVKWLCLRGKLTSSSMPRIPVLFPGLERLYFADAQNTLDLAPLAQMPGLRVVDLVGSSQPMTGTDALPDTVRILQPRFS